MFLPNLSIICEPVRKLTCKNTSLIWQSEQKIAFKIKQLVPASPALQFYHVTKEVTIQCDASSSELGAVLMQDGLPIASSKSTSNNRKKLCTEKECFAIAFAYTKFDQYIYIYTINLWTAAVSLFESS